MSFPGAPIPGFTGPEVEAKSSLQQATDPVLLDIAGVTEESGHDDGATSTPRSSFKHGSSHAPRHVMVVQVESYRRPRPSMIPLPGSGLVGMQAKSGKQAAARKASMGDTRAAQLPDAQAIDVKDARTAPDAASTSHDARVRVIHEGKPAVVSAAPSSLQQHAIQPPAAICIDFQLSLLSLFDDITAVTEAVDVASQLQAAAQAPE
jgi:hypothetical protein